MYANDGQAGPVTEPLLAFSGTSTPVSIFMLALPVWTHTDEDITEWGTLSDCEEYFKKADTHNQGENCGAKPA